MKIRFFSLLFAVGVFSTGSLLTAQSKDVTVVFKKGDNVRSLAVKYLKDANLWTEILKANDLSSVTQLKAGMKIIIPAGKILSAETELKKSKDMIHKASKAGARLFAPATISDAIELSENAVVTKKSSEWEKTAEYAKNAQVEAEKALTISKKKNDVSVEAVVNDRQGNVESKKEAALVWEESPLYSTLIERQKVRTLSGSFAEILFRDESRLRLNENSQAVIQQMKYNVLKNKQESSVSLIEGDIYALLSGTPKKKMDIKIAGVKTDINSNNFWVGKRGRNIKFANYDGNISVSSGGGTVLLGKNKGTLLNRSGQPINPEDLLPKVITKLPMQSAVVYKSLSSNIVHFEWEKVEGAIGYWLEIAYDKSSFQQIILSRSDIVKNSFDFPHEGVDGVYYWRVAAIDRHGFPGVKSDAKLVKILTDESLPFLTVNFPDERQIVRSAEIKVSGEVENSAKVIVNGQQAAVSDNGNFSADLHLEEGLNEYKISVIDIAGNENTQKRSVAYIPRQKFVLRNQNGNNSVAPNKYVAGDNGFTYAGETFPESFIRLVSLSSNFQSTAISDSVEGTFMVTAPLTAEKNSFRLEVGTPAGDESEETFEVALDSTPPEIVFKKGIPASVKSEKLLIEGELKNGVKLILNNRDIELDGQIFRKELKLQSGKNVLEFAGSDKLGNTAYFKKTVVFDPDPPKVLKRTLRKVDDNSFEIKVFVDDDSPLNKVAECELTNGEHTMKRFLKFQSATKYYRCIVNLSPQLSGTYKITKILWFHQTI